jgi:hypothetical protein
LAFIDRENSSRRFRLKTTAGSDSRQHKNDRRMDCPHGDAEIDSRKLYEVNRRLVSYESEPNLRLLPGLNA